MKILVAEDDKVSRLLLTSTIQQLGHEVIEAEDGEEAWMLFDRDPVRIIVSDWRMPKLDGLDLCRKVRERINTNYTYFILITAMNNEENQRYAMETDIDDFLTKPLNQEAICMRLRVAERILGFTKQISQLSEIVPICMYCNKIRDDLDYWERVESFIRTHTGANLSHGICPECYETQMKLL